MDSQKNTPKNPEDVVSNDLNPPRHRPIRVAITSLNSLPPHPHIMQPESLPLPPNPDGTNSQAGMPPSFQGQRFIRVQTLPSDPNSLLLLDEAERRRRNQEWTAAKASYVLQLIDRRQEIITMKPKVRPDIWKQGFLEVCSTIAVAHGDYLIALAFTFRINDLPPELLTEILRLAVWPLRNIAVDVRNVIRLTHVCGRWRSVALADKALWNPVCFVDPVHYERTFTLMERAGSNGLDIRIRDSQKTPLSKEVVTELIDRIFLKLTGIRKLDIYLFSREAVLPILRALERIAQFNLPMELEYLEMHSYRSPGAPEEFLPSIPLFGGAVLPTFRHLRLDGVNVEWNVALMSRLTTLDLRRIAMELLPSSSTFRAVLRATTGLEKLILDGAGPRYPLDDSTEYFSPVPIPTLKILVLGGFSDSYAEYVLAHFTAPNVLDFTIMFPIANSYSKLLTALTSTSKMPHIKILILVRVPLKTQPVTEESHILLAKWLVSMPDLTFLRMIDTSPAILRLLTFDELSLQPIHPFQRTPKRLICPKLLYVDYQNDAENINDLATLLRYRGNFGSHCKKLWLSAAVASKMIEEEKVKLWNSLEGKGVIRVSSLRTEEEEALCKQV